MNTKMSNELANRVNQMKLRQGYKELPEYQGPKIVPIKGTYSVSPKPSAGGGLYYWDSEKGDMLRWNDWDTPEQSYHKAVKRLSSQARQIRERETNKLHRSND